ncbi:MAG: hypothetical protein DRP75_03665, partial [Candidatus Omnitrophota bacterium]
MKILYITRKFPPSVGGMETHSYAFYNALRSKEEINLLAWGYSQIFLPLFILKVILQVGICISMRKNAYDCICLGDALLSPLGVLFKKIGGIPVVCIAHGLDVTFDFSLYQRVINRSIRRMDRVICVSRYTKRECLMRGVSESKIRVIPNGVSIQRRSWPPLSKETFLELLKERGVFIDKDTRIILSVGRLIKRKGIAEFIEDVLIQIEEEYPNLVYLIVGVGKERRRILRVIEKCALEDKVFLLGKVEDRLLY